MKTGFQKGHKFYKGGEKGWFKEGQKPWNTGKKYSEETRKKMSELKKGKAPWNKGIKAPQIALSKMGNKHPMWKGGPKDKCPECDELKKRNSKWCRSCANKGIRSPGYVHGLAHSRRTDRQNFMQGYKYRHWRIAVFERDNYTCKICGQFGGILRADHIKSYTYYPELRLDLDNGRTLCDECHKKTPNYGIKARVEGGGVYVRN